MGGKAGLPDHLHCLLKVGKPDAEGGGGRGVVPLDVQFRVVRRWQREATGGNQLATFLTPGENSMLLDFDCGALQWEPQEQGDGLTLLTLLTLQVGKPDAEGGEGEEPWYLKSSSGK